MENTEPHMEKMILLLMGLLLMVVSCEKSKDLKGDDLHPVKLENPVNGFIDINADQLADFAIEYVEYATHDVPSSGGSITGSLHPLNQNLLLFRNPDGYLFLDYNDTIRKGAEGNGQWLGFKADLITLNRHYETWDNEWTVLSDKHSNYMLGFKLLLGDAEKIGWLRLEFDTTNGDIFIMDGVYTGKGELIIQTIPN